MLIVNIPRGTTDPEIDSVTRIEFGNNMAPLELIANFSTRWCNLYLLHIWPPDGTTCIGCKFAHQMAPLALVANLVTRLRHLHQFQIWPPDGATCIGCKLGHQNLHWFKICPSGGATCIGSQVGHQVASLLNCPIGIISYRVSQKCNIAFCS